MRYEFHPIDFRAEVEEYRDSLSTIAFKEAFNEVINIIDSNEKGIKWFYFALVQLGNRNIMQCKNLFRYKPFIEEIDAIVEGYNASREQEALKIIKKDKADSYYARMLIPAFQNQAYEPELSENGKLKLEKLYGEEPVPEEFLQ